MKKIKVVLRSFIALLLVTIFTAISVSETVLAFEASDLIELKLSYEAKNIYVGDKIELATYGIYKENTIPLKENVTYESSNNNVFSIKDEKLIALNTGMATLTAYYKDKKVSQLIVVKDLKAMEDKLKAGDINVKLNWKREPNSIKLQWDKVDSMNSYTISKRVVGEEPYKVIVDKAEGNEFIDNDVIRDNEYEYQVSLIDKNDAKYPMNDFKVPIYHEEKNQEIKQEDRKQIVTTHENPVVINENNANPNKNVNANNTKVDENTTKPSTVQLSEEEYQKLLQQLKDQQAKAEQEEKDKTFQLVSEDLYGLEDLIVVNKDNTEVINKELTLRYYYDNSIKIDESKLTIYSMNDKGLLTELEGVKLDAATKKITFLVKEAGIYMIKERVTQQEIITYEDPKDDGTKDSQGDSNTPKGSETKNGEDATKDTNAAGQAGTQKDDATNINQQQIPNNATSKGTNTEGQVVDNKTLNTGSDNKNQSEASSNNTATNPSKQEENKDVVNKVNITDEFIESSLDKEIKIDKQYLEKHNNNITFKYLIDKASSINPDNLAIYTLNESKVLQAVGKELKLDKDKTLLNITLEKEGTYLIKDKTLINSNTEISKDNEQQVNDSNKDTNKAPENSSENKPVENNNNTPTVPKDTATEPKTDNGTVSEGGSKENTNDNTNNEQNNPNQGQPAKEENKNLTSNEGKFNLAVAGILSEVSAIEKEKVNDYINNIPKENGIWIPEKDRQFVVNIINFIANKKYYVNEKGFLKAVEQGIIYSTKSEIYSKLIDQLISGNKRIILSKDRGFAYYDEEDGLIKKSQFNEEESYSLETEGNRLLILNSKIFEELENGKLSNELALKLLNQLDEKSKEINSDIIKELESKAVKPRIKVVTKVALYASIGTPVSVQMAQGNAVYTGPDTVNYANIGSVDTNEWVTGMGVEKGWLYIEYSTSNGPKRGFVPLTSVRDYESIFQSTGTLTYTGYSDGLSSDTTVYSGPGTNYVPIGSIYKGEGITVFNKTQNGYVYVEYSSSSGTKRGFVPASLLLGLGRKRGTLASALQNTAIYSGPGTDGAYVSIGSVNYNEFVILLEWNDNWHYVEYNTTSGRKRGYTNRNNIGYIANLSDAGYIKDMQYVGVSSADQTTYTGPYSTYATMGSIGNQERVWVLVPNDAGYAYVEYGTSSGLKRGYVPANTITQAPTIVLPTISDSAVSIADHWQSGKGRTINAYKIGSGNKVLVGVFEVHGFEDAWAADGEELVKIATKLIYDVANTSRTNGGLNGWTVYIIPYANPDGLIDGLTKDGPGRTTIKERIDLNRSFPAGFQVLTSSRNNTGNTSLIPPEAKGLYNFITNVKKTANEMVVLDVHGWENTTIGNSEIGGYFDREFGFAHKGDLGGQGYFSAWAQSIGAKATLVELPWPNSVQDIINRGYAQKVSNAFVNIIKSNKTNDPINGPICYKAHVQNIGWQNYVTEGQVAGTTGQGLRVEAININKGSLIPGARIKYQVHVQNIGWMDYVYDGGDAGTTGRDLRIEAMRMQLEGAPEGYHIEYQAHVQDIGWMNPVRDGEIAGTTGQGKRIEAFKVNIVKNLPSRMNIDAPTEGQAINNDLYVYGWSLNQSGVKQAKVYIDGNFVGDAGIGLIRTDVKSVFPQYDNSDKSGFGYMLNVNKLSLGNHNIRIESIGNDNGTLSQSRNFSVSRLPSITQIDSMPYNNTYNDDFKVSGWALNSSGVKSVSILVDGNFKGYALTGLSRPDKKGSYPNYPNADTSGFDYTLGIWELSNGAHTVTAIATGNDGSTAQHAVGFTVNKSNTGSIDMQISILKSFFGGVMDAISENFLGLYKMISSPIQTLVTLDFLVKAVNDISSPEGQQLIKIVGSELEDIANQFKSGDANVRARLVGRAVGEIFIFFIVPKGIDLALPLLKKAVGITKIGKVVIEKGEKAAIIIEGAAEAVEACADTWIFAKGTPKHIFFGEINEYGAATGWHYASDASIKSGNEIISVIKEADEYGTIMGKVKIQGIQKEGYSSIFSTKYTPREVANMIEEAHIGRFKRFTDANGGLTNRWWGKADNGMTIEMYLDADGKVITAYPVHSSLLQ
ncbi:hypothetical protein JHL18_04705 [Clostridium sp. YIM B02505]|uniref:SH3b domain-containing protein n=1 Tax=Clostridium yunnanense TaxID=2800325 RepID=A0ABS1EKP7_9CLOT|nr:EndoU domain-containing protein [Clostridium yunnanense]MBK1809941.1 hypothetical protein [Clostridium yunnanense]